MRLPLDHYVARLFIAAGRSSRRRR